MMTMKQAKYFKQINLIFSILVIFLVSVYTGRIIIIKGIDPALLGLSVLFIICMLALGAAWVWLWTRRIAKYIQTVDAVIDAAIQGRGPVTNYEETALSSMEHKLLRYISVSKANEQTIQIEKNKIKTLISDISHQAKTPLSNIIVYSQLLEELPGLDEEARHYVKDIKVQSDKLDWLIQSLIKLSRLETGMISLQIEAKPLLQTITKALSQVYVLAESKQIEIRIDCTAQLTARHDAKWTSEALFNLLENAVKYTKPTGSIQITAESNEMFTRVDISDTGIGIGKEELPHIFKRFYRGQQAREAEGVGIGLFLAREIITAQGGHIKVTSESGKGTVFSLFFP
ncbi:sensor histidine kinase [Paenibacillus durus]|uniref:sensor histidine kinase n=1 Tax=Paenibacillus durus TaxID=44251 RepID=UPI00069350FC|nr:HAMP domain-containing sensor histidine kinase [Paenibacillus durus]